MFGYFRRSIPNYSHLTQPLCRLTAQDVKFECIKDKCSLLDSYSVGQNVKVSFNLRGNEYKDRYFVNLQAWRMEAADDAAPAPAGAPAAAAGDDRPPLDTYQEPADNIDDVLPF